MILVRLSAFLSVSAMMTNGRNAMIERMAPSWVLMKNSAAFFSDGGSMWLARFQSWPAMMTQIRSRMRKATIHTSGLPGSLP